jgi:hypothetical protein
MEDDRDFATYNAVGAFSDDRAARAAADDLRRAGYEGDRLSLAGDIAAERPSEPARRRRDAEIGRRARSGIPAAAVAGVVIGAAVAAALAGIVFDLGLLGILAFALVGAIAAGSIGFVVGGMSMLEDSRPSEASVVMIADAADEPEPVRRSLVGVHVDRREDLDRAVVILRGRGASGIDLFDREGNRVRA